MDAAAPSPPRWLTIASAVLIGLALVGFLLGSGGSAVAPAPSSARSEEAGDADALPAVVYAEMDGKARGPNRHWRADLASLVSRVPSATAAVAANGEDQRRAALARRAARRAYNGAPPVIPHPVDANDVSSCYQCHGEGREIDGLIAPRISHQRYTNCTQCHAQAGTPGAGPELPVANLFTGLSAPLRGERAYPGAPPTIPHQTMMRENCMACHGLLGLAGMRTPHPVRANCQQCHAPSARFDQRQHEDALPSPWEAGGVGR